MGGKTVAEEVDVARYMKGRIPEKRVARRAGSTSTRDRNKDPLKF